MTGSFNMSSIPNGPYIPGTDYPLTEEMKAELARVGDYDEPIFEPVAKSDTGFFDWLRSPPAASPAAGSAPTPEAKDSGGFFDWIQGKASAIKFGLSTGLAPGIAEGKKETLGFFDQLNQTFQRGAQAATILGIGLGILAIVILLKK